MKGYHVPRMAGWDCHGLPVELAVEKELGFTGKPDIEAYGIAEFNAKCRKNVQRHVDAFEAMSERMGYWADYEQRLLDDDGPDYVESVWWALKQIFDKGLLVEDYRVTPYCPRCGTGLSDHEVAQGYEEVTDPSVYVRFPLTSGPWAGRADLLVWTTTPWTLVSNVPSLSNPDVTYAVARSGEDTLVVAETLVGKVLGDDAEVARHLHRSRARTLGLPAPVRLRPARERAPSSSSPTTSRPTTVPASSTRHRRSAPTTSRRRGPTGSPSSTRSGGTVTSRRTCRSSAASSSRTPTKCSSPTSRRAGWLFRHVPYTHSYPHCWRCHTPLMYYALPSWYVRTTAIKDRLLAENETHRVVPGPHQARPLRRLAEQQHRLGAVAGPVLGHSVAGLAQRRRTVPHGVRGLAGRTAGAVRRRAGRSAPPVRRRHHLHPRRRGGDLPAGAAGDRCVVRLGLDAVRAVRCAASQRRPRAGGVPGGLHLRGDRPDPRLVLLADGGRHTGLRRERPTARCSASATSSPRTAAR